MKALIQEYAPGILLATIVIVLLVMLASGMLPQIRSGIENTGNNLNDVGVKAIDNQISQWNE